ncbi:MAG: hypothetical protein ACREJ3_08045, partial [Polyangiaceae bacterium]
LLTTRSRSRSHRQTMTPVEFAVAFALVGVLLAIAVPTLAREVRLSRFVEPVDGLRRMGASAVAFASSHPIAQAFPPSSPLTPGAPPRGRCEVDPPGTWDTPTWIALDFRPSPPSVAHCFAFRFDSTLAPAQSTFRADAHGDLDGDGLTSTFEVTGHAVEGDPRGPLLDRWMFVDSEVE